MKPQGWSPRTDEALQTRHDDAHTAGNRMQRGRPGQPRHWEAGGPALGGHSSRTSPLPGRADTSSPKSVRLGGPEPRAPGGLSPGQPCGQVPAQWWGARGPGRPSRESLGDTLGADRALGPPRTSCPSKSRLLSLGPSRTRPRSRRTRGRCPAGRWGDMLTPLGSRGTLAAGPGPLSPAGSSGDCPSGRSPRKFLELALQRSFTELGEI